MNTKEIRKIIIDSAHHAGHGHIPSGLSIVEILVAIDKIKTEDDIFVLSKGHGCLGYYAYLVQKGELTIDDVKNFGKKGSNLGGHPDRNKIRDVYASTGSLGHGFPISVGSALAKKIKGENGRVFCLIGDGEANEGTIWESCMIAATNNLSNLICIVDNNKSQERSLPSVQLYDKFDSFGWSTIEVDGHNQEQLIKAFEYAKTYISPTMIVANTVKGKGISEIENDMFAWHHRAPTEEEYKRFCEEIYEN